ncbi:hypothetical protein KC343_g14891 [Hortaea werneckii]|nr:hypothetical protein KC323_g7107 [Hortaea werneckii]KAI6859170.1 hypothetical protein KC338_g7402 [Hortaea werneckii]KAI7160417.1 hypothetical protein KC352_g26965 [Hortaea werneckii]KAI7347463.1 hypothetical protein KC320_g7219 [Hortaea werneckii]KAI7548240.1 hypothetical protein KC317_g14909 [Hortaea werneckii]
MATSSPHKKMMVLSLQQLEGNLLNLERDRANLITAIPFGPRTSDELPFEVLLREADQCCKEQGEILLYITRLTLTPGYYERPHRIQRLLHLLDSLMYCVDTVIAAAERLHADKSIREWPTNQKMFIMARSMLSTGRDMIKIQHASNDSEDSGSDVSRDSSSTVISKSEYLQKPAPYTWESSGQNFLRELSCLWASLLGEANVPEPYIERTKAVYSIMWTTSRPMCKEAEAVGHNMDRSNINSVWLSPMTDGALDKTNYSDYLRISRAVYKKYTDMPRQFHGRRDNYFQHPLILAQGLLELGIEVGFLFANDSSVIVWPLRSNAETVEASVIVHCTRVFTGRDVWLYKVLLPCGSKSENIGQTNMQAVGQRSAGFTTQLLRTTSMCKHDFSSLFGARNEGKNFFDLPPELRNVIYQDCVKRPYTECDTDELFCWKGSHDHYGENYSTDLAELDPSALCRTSRRIRDEILPLLLANKFLSVDVSSPPWKEDSSWSFIDTRILTARNKWLAHSPNTICLMGITILGKSFGERFTAWIRLTDFSPGFALGIDYGSKWKSEKVPGGNQIPTLVRIIMMDKETAGLTLADVACIADFFGEKYKRWSLT